MSDRPGRARLQAGGTALAVAALVACGGSPTPSAPLAAAAPSPSPSAMAASGSCVATLDQFCDGACRSYDESVKLLRALCSDARPGAVYSGGQCPGVFYMTQRADPFGVRSEYFDGNGTMIGGMGLAYQKSFCDEKSLDVRAGFLPVCPREPEMEVLCSR